MRKYNKKRRDNDLIFKFIGNVRNLIKNAFLRKFALNRIRLLIYWDVILDFYKEIYRESI